MQNFIYIATPLLAWVSAGLVKLAINSARDRSLALHQVGLGGFPSTHNTITSAMVMLIAWREGLTHPALGVAITVALIVAIDAMDLRRHVGRQAAAIAAIAPDLEQARGLRQRIGHSFSEIAGGWVTGAIIAAGIHLLSR